MWTNYITANLYIYLLPDALNTQQQRLVHALYCVSSNRNQHFLVTIFPECSSLQWHHQQSKHHPANRIRKL